MSLKRSAKRVRLTPKERLRKIRSLWRKTEAGMAEKKHFKGSIDDEIDTYFKATIFNASLHLETLTEPNSSTRSLRLNAKKLRDELRLAGELGSYLIRRVQGFL